MKSKVFVYGTLMRGYGNHSLLNNSSYLGEGQLQGYSMYHVSSFPGIVKSDTNNCIKGELYEVTPEELKRLDRLEGEGHLYKRVTEEIKMAGQGLVHAFTYVWLGSVKNCQEVIETPWEPLKINYEWR